MIRILQTLVLSVAIAGQAVGETSAEQAKWWHGTFLFESHREWGCVESDSIVTFSASEAGYWENACEILRAVELPEMRAVLLDLYCTGEMDTTPDYRRRELLKSHATDPADMARVGMTVYPGAYRMLRCDGLDRGTGGR